MVSLLTFTTSVILTLLMIRWGKKDIPLGRSSHTIPTSRSGGIAILGAFGFGLFLLNPEWEQCEFLFGCLGFGVLGFIDDSYSLPAPLRLLIQGGLGLVLALSMLGHPQTFLETAYLFAASFWVVAFVNAFNFMDGLNGMSGLSTLVFCGFFILLFPGLNLPLVLPLVLMAAVSGFLIWNIWGKIFLGDGGGYFLGAFLACFPLDALARTQPAHVILIPAFFGIYLFDTGITLIHRLWQGKNLMEAHKEHLYQKLQQTGWSHIAVSGLYAGFAFYQGALVYFFPDPLVIYPLLILSYSLYGLWVIRRFQSCVENPR